MDLNPLLLTLLCTCIGADLDCPIGSQCKLLKDCEPLVSELRTSNSSKKVHETLKKLGCGFEKFDVKVCCPTPDINTLVNIVNNGKDCVTPHGEPGTCTKVDECGYMYAQLRSGEFVSSEYMEFIKKSKCAPQGRTKTLDVCCKSDVSDRPSSSPPSILDNMLTSQCPQTVFPPEPDSSCCGLDSGSPKIIGGQQATIDQFPWLVMLEYPEEAFRCGGSLISGQYILTAAHCLVVRSMDNDIRPTSVRIGDFNVTNPGSDCVVTEGGGEDCTDGDLSVPIEDYIVHPDYDPKQVLHYHDIGLIRLKYIVNYTDFIRPICLPTSDFTTTASDNLEFFIAGWGVFDEFQQTPSDVKLFAKVKYVDKEQCHDRFKKVGGTSLIGSQLCVGGEKNRGHCRGDSGGPLMYYKIPNYEVAGVISFGAKRCGLANWPSIYTKVYDYLDWIRDNIKP